jgi:hypothetical protein
VARRLGLAASTVRAIDLRYLTRWAAGRRKPALRQMGIMIGGDLAGAITVLLLLVAYLVYVLAIIIVFCFF